jgi:hypothetical protein
MEGNEPGVSTDLEQALSTEVEKLLKECLREVEDCLNLVRNLNERLSFLADSLGRKLDESPDNLPAIAEIVA